MYYNASVVVVNAAVVGLALEPSSQDVQANFDCSIRVEQPKQGCQMVYFQTKNPSLGKFWRALQWKMLVYFMDIWSILYMFRTFGMFCGNLVYFSPFWHSVQRKIRQP
jgi:hypothetical protein